MAQNGSELAVSFPRYADGDVEIIITGLRRYKLHKHVLCRLSSVFEELLSIAPPKITSVAKKRGRTTLYRLVLEPLPEGWTFVHDYIGSNGLSIEGRLFGLGLENGMPEVPLHVAFDNWLRAAYGQTVNLDQSDVHSTLRRALPLLNVADRLDCVSPVSPLTKGRVADTGQVDIIITPIEAALLGHGQALWAAIAFDPCCWMITACRLKSRKVFSEAVIHAVGRFGELCDSADASHSPDLTPIPRLPPDLQALVRKKRAALLTACQHLEQSLVSFYPDNVIKTATIGVAGPDRTRRRDYADDVLKWMALALYRELIGSQLARNRGHNARDTGFAFYSSLDASSMLSVDQNIMAAFRENFPMSNRSMNVIRDHLYEIHKAACKDVPLLLASACQLDTKSRPVPWLTCMNLTEDDFLCDNGLRLTKKEHDRPAPSSQRLRNMPDATSGSTQEHDAPSNDTAGGGEHSSTGAQTPGVAGGTSTVLFMIPHVDVPSVSDALADGRDQAPTSNSSSTEDNALHMQSDTTDTEVLSSESCTAPGIATSIEDGHKQESGRARVPVVRTTSFPDAFFYATRTRAHSIRESILSAPPDIDSIEIRVISPSASLTDDEDEYGDSWFTSTTISLPRPRRFRFRFPVPPPPPPTPQVPPAIEGIRDPLQITRGFNAPEMPTKLPPQLKYTSITYSTNPLDKFFQERVLQRWLFTQNRGTEPIWIFSSGAAVSSTRPNPVVCPPPEVLRLGPGVQLTDSEPDSYIEELRSDISDDFDLSLDDDELEAQVDPSPQYRAAIRPARSPATSMEEVIPTAEAMLTEEAAPPDDIMQVQPNPTETMPTETMLAEVMPANEVNSTAVIPLITVEDIDAGHSEVASTEGSAVASVDIASDPRTDEAVLTAAQEVVVSPDIEDPGSNEATVFPAEHVLPPQAPTNIVRRSVPRRPMRQPLPTILEAPLEMKGRWQQRRHPGTLREMPTQRINLAQPVVPDQPLKPDPPVDAAQHIQPAQPVEPAQIIEPEHTPRPRSMAVASAWGLANEKIQARLSRLQGMVRRPGTAAADNSESAPSLKPASSLASSSRTTTQDNQ